MLLRCVVCGRWTAHRIVVLRVPERIEWPGCNRDCTLAEAEVKE